MKFYKKADETNWLKRLTKKQIIHLLKTGSTTLEKFQETRKFQLEWVQSKNYARDGFCTEPCWDCREIAQRLGLE